MDTQLLFLQLFGALKRGSSLLPMKLQHPARLNLGTDSYMQLKLSFEAPPHRQETRTTPQHEVVIEAKK